MLPKSKDGKGRKASLKVHHLGTDAAAEVAPDDGTNSV